MTQSTYLATQLAVLPEASYIDSMTEDFYMRFWSNGHCINEIKATVKRKTEE